MVSGWFQKHNFLSIKNIREYFAGDAVIKQTECISFCEPEHSYSEKRIFFEDFINQHISFIWGVKDFEIYQS